MSRLPTLLPEPLDDGAGDHLADRALPSIALPSTDGGLLDLSRLSGCVVLFVYPMTAVPGRVLPEGWDVIPGARGCTPQACGFRDLFGELRAKGVSAVYGLSVQNPKEQAEAVTRLELPFALLSDEAGAFGEALAVPAFEVDGTTYLKRLTLLVQDGRIAKVFYPVFPPDRSAANVLAYLCDGDGACG